MIKLVLTSIIGLMLALPISSNAAHIFGVNTIKEKKELINNAKHGYVAQNLQDTFQVQELENKEFERIDSISDGYKYVIFGVILFSIDMI